MPLCGILYAEQEDYLLWNKLKENFPCSRGFVRKHKSIHPLTSVIIFSIYTSTHLCSAMPYVVDYNQSSVRTHAHSLTGKIVLTSSL